MTQDRSGMRQPEQSRADQQRLGLGGVADLLGVGLGAQVHQVGSGQVRPRPQPCFSAGKIEPGSQKPRFLRTLSRG